MEALKQLHPNKDPNRDNLPLPGDDHQAVLINKVELMA
jgi:hypothetical protein